MKVESIGPGIRTRDWYLVPGQSTEIVKIEARQTGQLSPRIKAHADLGVVEEGTYEVIQAVVRIRKGSTRVLLITGVNCLVSG